MAKVGPAIYYPSVEAVTNFEFDQVRTLTDSNTKNPPQPGATLLSLKIPAGLTQHRLYHYIYAHGSGAATDYFLRTEIAFFRNKLQLPGAIPAAVGVSAAGASVVNSPIMSIASGSIASPNCMLFILDRPDLGGAGQTTSPLFLQPFECEGDFDEIRLLMREQRGIDDGRVFLACVSTPGFGSRQPLSIGG